MKSTNLLKSHLPQLWVEIANTLQQMNQKSITSFLMYSTTNPKFIFQTLPQLGKDLEKGLENGYFILTPGAFKRLKGAVYPVFLKEYFSMIFYKTGELKDNFDPSLLRELRTMLYLFYKFETPFSSEEVDQACIKFCDVDESVKTSFTDEQINLLKPIIKELVFDDPSDVKPRHSSGATANRVSNREKRTAKAHIPQLNEVYSTSLLFNSRSHAQAWLRTNSSLETLTPHSKVTLVPKDSRGPRIICMEHHLLMFFQQGIMHRWYDYIERISPAKGYINFSDQTINQRLAYSSSMDRKYATIDLKDASDMVSWELVKRVFPADWVAAFKATRSAFADLPNQTTRKLKKFAPMGSALCFPVEAVIFYSICKLVTDTVWVYGDDIIVPLEHAVAVMDLLESYGLLINRDKSLYKGFFRESCGGDYYKGYNITPIRCKSVDIESIYALANNIASALGSKAGEAVCNWSDSVTSSTLLRLPHSYKQDNLLAFFSDHSNEYLLCTRRYNKDLQKYELKGLGLKQTTRLCHKDSDTAYDFLHDYFTNSHDSLAPKQDEEVKSIIGDDPFLNKEIKVPHGPLKDYIDNTLISTSSVYSDTTSRVGYTWVEHKVP